MSVNELLSSEFPSHVIFKNPGVVTSTLVAANLGVLGLDSPGVVTTLTADHGEKVPSLYFHLN